MRLSLNHRDRAYDPMKIGSAHITLNGETIERCVTADEEEGFVDFYTIDPEGRLAIGSNRVKIERKTGTVRIKLAEGG